MELPPEDIYPPHLVAQGFPVVLFKSIQAKIPRSGCLLLVFVHACSVVSVMSDSETPWTGAHQAPLSVGFSRQEHWSGLPCPPPGNLPNPGIKPTGGFFTTEQPGKPCLCLPALYLLLIIIICIYN